MSWWSRAARKCSGSTSSCQDLSLLWRQRRQQLDSLLQATRSSHPQAGRVCGRGHGGDSLARFAPCDHAQETLGWNMKMIAIALEQRLKRLSRRERGRIDVLLAH